MEKITVSEAIEQTAGQNTYQFRLVFLCCLCQLGVSCYHLGLDFMVNDSKHSYTAAFMIEDDVVQKGAIIGIDNLGIPIGSLVLLWMFDKFGRKYILQMISIWYIIFLFFVVISLSSLMLMFCSLFLGFFLNSCISGTFILLLEVVPEKSRVKMTSILMAC